MKPRARTGMAALALCLMLGVQPTPPASAQIPVIDPANLAQSITQVTHMVQQLRNQVQQIEQATAMLRQNPLQLSPELSQSIGEARALFNSVQGVAFEAHQLGEDPVDGLHQIGRAQARPRQRLAWCRICDRHRHMHEQAAHMRQVLLNAPQSAVIDVVAHECPGLVGDLGLTAQEEAALVAYMKTFTDTALVKKPHPFTGN